MATPNASQPIDDLAVVQELLVLARKTDRTSYAYKQLLLLILSTVQAAVVESSPHPSFYNAFESSGGPSVNPEVQDDGENEGEDGEDVEDTGEDTREDTGEDTREDTHQPVGRPRNWYTFLPTMHPYCDKIPHMREPEVLPHIMTRLTQMLNGTVNVYKVERVSFNHGSDGWNVVFTFERSPLNHAYPIHWKEGWMKVGHLHIKESF
jgi:hypothetical protein